MNTLEGLTHARKHGVSPSMLHVLLIVLGDSPITPTRIADATGLTVAATGGTCERLARDGWVTLGKNPYDRRSRLVTPTPKAVETFSDVLG